MVLSVAGDEPLEDGEGRRKARLLDLDRLEAALRRAAGLSTRPTGAVIAGLGVAGDRGARV